MDKHFAHEEHLQRDNKYPDMAGHKALHDSYKKQLKEIASQINGDNLSLADLARLNGHIAVLVNHICIEDKRLGNFLKQK